MGVYIPRDKAGRPKSPFYHYDFKLRPKGASQSQRFHGSTGQRAKKKAEGVEAAIRELAALGRLNCAITVEQACQRYWDERLIHSRSADEQAGILESLCEYFGRETLLVSIGPDEVAKAAERRSRARIRRYNRKAGAIVPTNLAVTSSTINRQIVEPMRRLLRRAKKAWRLPIDLEQFDWGALAYEEPAERTRELSIEEEVRFWQALRPDYAPICELYIISGRRRSDWVGLRKFKVDRTAGTVRFPTRKRKQQGEIVVELTDRELQIINEEWLKAPTSEFVFTYEARAGGAAGRGRPERRPITFAGLRRAVGNAFKKAKLDNFRFHDFRHTFASRAGRAAGGDLRRLMVAMDHQDISSTVRYRHVLSREIKDVRSAVRVSRNSPGLDPSSRAQDARNNK